MKLYLIGMPGSGKSTIGRELANELAFPFIDLDIEIEKQEGRSVKEIFSTSGEDYFRQAESKALKHFALSDESFVLATGGGAPCFYDGIKVINQTGISIFLDVPVPELIARVEQDTTRPLLASGDKDELKTKLENIRSSRLKVYKQAAFTIRNATVKMILEKIRK